MGSKSDSSFARARKGKRFDQLTPTLGSLGVLTRLVEGVERSPDLKAGGFVCLAWGATERDDGRPRLLSEGRPLDPRGDEDESTRGRVHLLIVQLEAGAATLHEVQLLL